MTLNKAQRDAFLSILGQDTQQKNMAASHFEMVPHGGMPDTYSVFLNRHDGVVDKAAIRKFSNEIGFPVNVSQYPNGTLVDVNIGGFEHLPRPTAERCVHAEEEGAASLRCRSIEGALRTIAGYEAMNMIRKGQIR